MALKERLQDFVKKAVPDWLQVEILKIYGTVRKDWKQGMLVAKKEFELAKDVALIDYNSLRESIGNLNIILRSCNNNRTEKIMFGLRTSDSDSFLWKSLTKVLCLKIDMTEKSVKVTRSMTVSAFWRLRAELLEEVRYKNLLEGGCSGEFQLINHEGEVEGVEGGEWEENDLPIPCSLSVSGVFARVEKVVTNDDLDKECSICMDSKVEVSLPCTHTFCTKCIEMWHGTNQSCPVCRDHLNKPEDCWEFTELPDLEEINEKLVEMATGGNES